MNETDPVKLRNLKGNDLLLVDDILLMRGLDYRCKTGIDLLLAKPIPKLRERHQALGRVGRCTDRGNRYELPPKKLMD